MGNILLNAAMVIAVVVFAFGLIGATWMLGRLLLSVVPRSNAADDPENARLAADTDPNRR